MSHNSHKYTVKTVVYVYDDGSSSITCQLHKRKSEPGNFICNFALGSNGNFFAEVYSTYELCSVANAQEHKLIHKCYRRCHINPCGVPMEFSRGEGLQLIGIASKLNDTKF